MQSRMEPDVPVIAASGMRLDSSLGLAGTFFSEKISISARGILYRSSELPNRRE
jgi:hypothetical protein